MGLKKYCLNFCFLPQVLRVCVCMCVQVDVFCKLMSDFSMEYRTTHDKIMARLERKKHEKERKKTKGKFIVSEKKKKKKKIQTKLNKLAALKLCSKQTHTSTKPSPES